ncbi:MAG TPA: 2-phospho-L-lactate guanylyltransferase [Blastocatellia bacterium]|nr:2-phospho-L-lactate guanylyltransferase [Blastocatellia bacterium]
MNAIVVPIKEPAEAKTRLAEFMSADERQRLAWAMFMDVTRALADVEDCATVFVVTSYDRAARHGRAKGFGVLYENQQSSESASVDWASAILAARGFDSVLRLPADVPLVRGRDIQALLLTDLAGAGAIMVPSRDGSGTNAILRHPPRLFDSRFGPNSLTLHIAEAQRAGAMHLIVPNERIALDIDEPADIEALLEHGAGTETYQVLTEIGAPSRFRSQLRGRV